jgi:hypothetical protein
VDEKGWVRRPFGRLNMSLGIRTSWPVIAAMAAVSVACTRTSPGTRDASSEVGRDADGLELRLFESDASLPDALATDAFPDARRDGGMVSGLTNASGCFAGTVSGPVGGWRGRAAFIGTDRWGRSISPESVFNVP